MRKLLASLVLCSTLCVAQTLPPTPEPAHDLCGPKHLDRCAVNVLRDQAGIWSSPARLHKRDFGWIVPFAAVTGVTMYYDADAQVQLGKIPTRSKVGEDISRFGSPYATLGEGAAIYGIGALTHNDHLAETGRLAFEAVIDASIVAEGFKLMTDRERPSQGEGGGESWPGKYRVNSSFPSGHAAASWALARVIGDEYQGFGPRLLAYSFATAISISRVTAGDHFPSDALVGSGLGFLVGGYVYRHHSTRHQERTFMVMPVYDTRMRSYGASLRLWR
jgi:membrane-associated phospholipid phosphatase